MNLSSDIVYSNCVLCTACICLTFLSHSWNSNHTWALYKHPIHQLQCSSFLIKESRYTGGRGGIEQELNWASFSRFQMQSCTVLTTGMRWLFLVHGEGALLLLQTCKWTAGSKKPIQESSEVQWHFLGVGQFTMELIFSGSVLMPLLEMTWPRNTMQCTSGRTLLWVELEVAYSLQRWHFTQYFVLTNEILCTSFPNNCCNPRLIPDGKLLACLLHWVHFLYSINENKKLKTVSDKAKIPAT